MNLKKMVFIEIGSVIVIIALVLIFIEASPYLASSQDTSIGVYNEHQFQAGNVTLTRGYIVNTARFTYPSFDPAILVVDLDFQTWTLSGNLTVSINGIVLGTVFASPENPHIKLTAVAFSGFDLVAVNTKYSPIQGNIVYFSSRPDGYEGTFSYQINVRGSR